MSRENHAVVCLDFLEVVPTAYNASSKTCCPTLEKWTREFVQVSRILDLFTDLLMSFESIIFLYQVNGALGVEKE